MTRRIGICGASGIGLGALLFNSEEGGRLAKHLTTMAPKRHKWEYLHGMLGYDFRMPNINAALGWAQLESLPGFLESNRRLALHYKAAFSCVAGLSFADEPKSCRSNCWLSALLLSNAAEREVVLQATDDAGIMTRPAWMLMHRLPMDQACPRMELPVATSLDERILNIPNSAARA